MERTFTALFSTFDTTGVPAFAAALQQRGWRTIASKGTAAAIRQAGGEIEDLASLIGQGPLAGHRVVTLYPAVHLGLQLPNDTDSAAILDEFGMPRIDLLCCDPYTTQPLREHGKPSTSRDAIDVGGPAMIASIVKSLYEDELAADDRRLVVTSATQFTKVLGFLDDGRRNAEVYSLLLAGDAISRIVSDRAQLYDDLAHRLVVAKARMAA